MALEVIVKQKIFIYEETLRELYTFLLFQGMFRWELYLSMSSKHTAIRLLV